MPKVGRFAQDLFELFQKLSLDSEGIMTLIIYDYQIASMKN